MDVFLQEHNTCSSHMIQQIQVTQPRGDSWSPRYARKWPCFNPLCQAGNASMSFQSECAIPCAYQLHVKHRHKQFTHQSSGVGRKVLQNICKRAILEESALFLEPLISLHRWVRGGTDLWKTLGVSLLQHRWQRPTFLHPEQCLGAANRCSRFPFNPFQAKVFWQSPTVRVCDSFSQRDTGWSGSGQGIHSTLWSEVFVHGSPQYFWPIVR